MNIGRVKITAGFVLLWTFIFYIDAGSLMWLVWCGATCHELGHFAAIWLCGGKIGKFEFNSSGLTIRLAQTPPISYLKEIICVFCGPLAGLLSALIFCALSDKIQYADVLVGICVLQTVFNLLPCAGLDGGRIVYLLLMWKEKHNAQKIIKTLTLTVAFLTAALGLFAFIYTGKDFMVLFAAIFLTAQMLAQVKESMQYS